jgi:hypothetical protein
MVDAATVTTLATIAGVAESVAPTIPWEKKKLKTFSVPVSTPRTRSESQKAKKKASRAKTQARKARRGY